VSFALGFAELGHDVWLLEDSGDQPWGFDLDRLDFDHDCRYGVRRLAEEMDAVGLGDRWMFRHVPTGRVDGLDAGTAMDVLADADILVNVSLTTPPRPEYRRIPHRLGIDTDPVFNQIRMGTGSSGETPADWHTRLFTFGRPPLLAARPDDEWVPTRQPVATRQWPVASPPRSGAPFTTVTHWEAYAGLEWEGVRYGTKGDSLREFADLPRRTEVPLTIALGGGDRPQRTMRDGGWDVIEPTATSRTTADYRGFLAASAGEIGFAKHGYVAARSGWFSDRTCCYLASGRPAVVQDTGWSDWLPTGDGLFAFRTPDDAVAALEEVAADPERHAGAARKITEEHFEASRVCADLLEAL
jgi:hypothetical protein